MESREAPTARSDDARGGPAGSRSPAPSTGQSFSGRVARRLRRLRGNLRVFGAIDTLRQLVGGATPDDFDRRFGIDTSRVVAADAADLPAAVRESARDCQPTQGRVLEDVVRSFPFDPSRYAFVDLGCGTGRALVAAARRPFRRVLGIEAAPSHAAAARANVDAARRSGRARWRTDSIEVVTGDVREGPLPAPPIFFFAFNPFGASILGDVLARVAPTPATDASAVPDVVLAGVHLEDCEGLLERAGSCILRRDVLSDWWCWSLWRIDDTTAGRVLPKRRAGAARRPNGARRPADERDP